MTYPPGASGAALDPQSRTDRNKPQGLKSAPHIPNPSYPHLGFNPVPGSTETVSGLRKKLSGCAKVLEETHGLVTTLMDGSYWEGDAAVAFREQLDGGPLPLNLKNAAHSIRKAAKQLDRWEGELDDFQRRAKRLEDDAKEAQAAVDRAKGHAGTAGASPDLDKNKKGAKHDEAQKVLTKANTAVDDAEDALEKIRGKARKLADEHEQQARHRAGKIRDATKKLVPHEPGWFDSALDWLDENLPDILSTVAAVIGLVALFVVSGGTAAAVLLLAAAALSATSLALRIARDPTVWASLKDGFTKGELDTDFWSNFVTVGGDVLGTLPGLGAAWKGASAALRVSGEAGEAVTMGQRLARFGSSTMEHAKSISDLDNAVLGFAIRGARAAQVTRAVEVTSASVGVATAGFGLVMTAVDTDDDGIKDGSVAGIDGARLGLDVGGLFDVARHVF
ncbi:putative T7SS-secreted protein [Streptomyces sp. NBC_00203]|uniref:putative T7SS-secreted protein n=1 Tax=Streptomyces sp. NBC_00203 TaxID=2975680 RepID=UPI003249E8F1